MDHGLPGGSTAATDHGLPGDGTAATDHGLPGGSTAVPAPVPASAPAPLSASVPAPLPAPVAALRHVGALASGGALPAGARVTMNLHPDRLTPDGVPLLRQLARDGRYLSQFATGTSNGGLTAWPGGDRPRWESRIFGGAYDTAAPHERPVYGALDPRGAPGGGAPRFGSSYLRLRPDVLDRSTFCYPDSAAEPVHFGVAGRCDLLERCRTGGRDPLDAYVEAQVHGPVLLECDVEALVLDPAYRGTAVERDARRLPCPLEWHPGFRVSVERVRREPEFRGSQFVELAARVAVDGLLDPRIIGDAVRAGGHDPQDLKKVWHYLARFGPPPSAAQPSKALSEVAAPSAPPATT